MQKSIKQYFYKNRKFNYEENLCNIFITISLSFCFPTCLPVSARQYKKLSQLEIREIQSHVYQTSNTKEVFKATINALQDEDFAIINIEDGLGYIRAKKEYKAKRTDKKRATLYSILFACSAASLAIGGGASAAQSTADSLMHLTNELAAKTVVVDMNANIEPFGKQTRVRLTMVEKVLYNADGYSYVKSSPRDVVRIYNTATYQSFFNEIDKSVFYEKI